MTNNRRIFLVKWKRDPDEKEWNTTWFPTLREAIELKQRLQKEKIQFYHVKIYEGWPGNDISLLRSLLGHLKLDWDHEVNDFGEIEIVFPSKSDHPLTFRFTPEGFFIGLEYWG